MTVLAQNGRLSTTGLTGALDLATTNGRIQTGGSRGDLDLRTTNGGIDVRGSSSGRVSATTTNGEVDSASVPTDPSARRSITAATTNSTVAVQTR